jgi:PAS domain S-box-containing protein
VDVRRLRQITIVIPICFLVLLALFSLVVLGPQLGNSFALRITIIFAILLSAVIPFSLWVFHTLERQQRDLAAGSELLDSVQEYAIFRLDARGRIDYWSRGAALVKGYSADEVIGKDISMFYTPEDVAEGVPQEILRTAAAAGRHEAEGWRVRKDGSRFMANVVSTAHRDGAGRVTGFTNVVRDMTERRQAEDSIRALNDELERRVEELNTWSAELETRVAERTREIQRYSKELMTRVLQAQEEERKRIARELHDDTAQSLSTLLINLDLLEGMLPTHEPSVDAGFERLRALGRRTLSDVRAMSHDLRPTILDDFGLVAALNWYADEYAATFGVKVKVDADPTPAALLPAEVQTLLFRIAQEALTNSAKHAHATWARVSLVFPEGSVKLIVQDDGSGFDPAQLERPTRSGGLGLYGIRERASLLNATLSIESAHGEGTTITVVAPLTRARVAEEESARSVE